MDFAIPFNLVIYFPLLFIVTIVYAILDCLWSKPATKKDFISDTSIKETKTPVSLPQTLPSLPSSPLQDEPTINRIRRSNRIKKNRGMHKNRRQRF
jgi:hypothetical protein